MTEIVINKDKDFTDLTPILAGEEECCGSHSFGPYVRNYYLVHYCLSGGGKLIDKYGEHKIGKGELFIIRPGEQTTYTADKSDPWHYVWLGFVGKLAERFSTDRSVYSCSESPFLRLRELITADEHSPHPYAAVIHGIIHILFGSERYEPNGPSAVRRYIEYNYMRPITVGELSSLFAFERSHLFRIFKSRYGKGVKEYLTDFRISRAKEFLSLGYTVGDTATMVGYPDEFNFSKIFKKHVGISPAEYKKTAKAPQGNE